jgi:hypothetical protein
VLRRRTLPAAGTDPAQVERQVKRVRADVFDLYWRSGCGVGRDEFLAALVDAASRSGWSGEFGNEWASWDLNLIGDRWHDVTVRTATEELGWPERFTRARCTVRLGPYGRIACAAAVAWAAAAVVSFRPWAMVAALGLLGACAGRLVLSLRRCRRAVSSLLWSAGRLPGLEPVEWRGGTEAPAAPGLDGSRPMGLPSLADTRLAAD